MDNFPSSPEVIGIGFVAVTAFWVLWKLISRMFDIMEKNTKSNYQLSENIKKNTETTEEMKKTLEQNNEFFKILMQSQLRIKKDDPSS